jgi:hypothetical protein
MWASVRGGITVLRAIRIFQDGVDPRLTADAVPDNRVSVEIATGPPSRSSTRRSFG